MNRSSEANTGGYGIMPAKSGAEARSRGVFVETENVTLEEYDWMGLVAGQQSMLMDVVETGDRP
jgi:hypothetical protein